MQTGHVGDYTIGHVPTRRGFDSFLGFWGGSQNYFSHANDFRENETYAQAKYNHQYSTTIFSDKAVDIIRAQPGTAGASPFFIYLAYQATHSPLQAPDFWLARFNNTAYGPVAGSVDRQIFAAMAGCMDEGVGNISDALQASPDVYASTVIFFSGDNGGQVTEGGSNWPLRGARPSDKHLFFDCAWGMLD